MSWVDEVFREFEKIRRRIEKEIDRIMREYTALKPDLTPDGSLQPLYTLYEYSDRYIILVDLPVADTSTLEVKVVDDKLVLEARLERSIRLGDVYGHTVGQEISVSRYKQVIPLPADADAEKTEVKVRPTKIIEIVIPKKKFT